jgi:hypothetical protein
MNPSKLLRRFLDSGKRPSSQRDASALLDEARSHLVSKLPTTDETIQNFSDADIEKITAGGKTGTLERAHKIFLANQRQQSAPSTAKAVVSAPAPRQAPTAQPAPAPPAASKPPAAPRLTESTDILMCAVKCSRLSDADRAAARAELQLRGYTELESGAFSISQ